MAWWNLRVLQNADTTSSASRYMPLVNRLKWRLTGDQMAKLIKTPSSIAQRCLSIFIARAFFLAEQQQWMIGWEGWGGEVEVALEWLTRNSDTIWPRVLWPLRKFPFQRKTRRRLWRKDSGGWLLAGWLRGWLGRLQKSSTLFYSTV